MAYIIHSGGRLKDIDYVFLGSEEQVKIFCEDNDYVYYSACIDIISQSEKKYNSIEEYIENENKCGRKISSLIEINGALESENKILKELSEKIKLSQISNNREEHGDKINIKNICFIVAKKLNGSFSKELITIYKKLLILNEEKLLKLKKLTDTETETVKELINLDIDINIILESIN